MCPSVVRRWFDLMDLFLGHYSKKRGRIVYKTFPTGLRNQSGLWFKCQWVTLPRWQIDGFVTEMTFSSLSFPTLRTGEPWVETIQSKRYSIGADDIRESFCHDFASPLFRVRHFYPVQSSHLNAALFPVVIFFSFSLNNLFFFSVRAAATASLHRC